ncbi:MAG: glycerate kinase [Tissierellia bacterium]|nr:glycerate kinase [Tissierellia bacterium]
MTIRDDAFSIINQTIKSVQPDQAVKKALDKINLNASNLYLLSIGKAAWTMANAACKILGDRIKKGIVITKYDHVMGEIPGIDCYEAGHPISDANSYFATDRALDMVSNLNEDDLVLFLVSGGGSALFEKPMVDSSELESINKQLLASGADIEEINTIRKRLSMVKGGRFAQICSPARIEVIVLSDVLGDPLDIIASGPAYPDSSSSQDALNIVEKYDLILGEGVKVALCRETPKVINNANHTITGSVKDLILNAERHAKSLGYKTLVLTDQLDCIAKEAGTFMGAIARSYLDRGPIAIILGGETVVELTGPGKGGRNQELALSAAQKISSLDNVVIFSVGSDGTDGPTDAAGAIVDGFSKDMIEKSGKKIYEILKENDSYNYLKSIDGLVMTGPTGTNVNDFSVILIGKK